MSTYYRLRSLNGALLTMTDVSHLIFHETPHYPFIQVLRTGETRDVEFPELVSVEAVGMENPPVRIAGEEAETIRVRYARKLRSLYSGSDVVYTEDLDDHTGDLIAMAYVYEIGTLYAYEAVECLMRERLDNVSVIMNSRLGTLQRERVMPRQLRGDEELVEIPEGTYDEVVAGIREHLAATPGITVLRPEGDKVESDRNYGVIVDEGVDLDAVLRAYDHPITTALRIDLSEIALPSPAVEFSIK